MTPQRIALLAVFAFSLSACEADVAGEPLDTLDVSMAGARMLGMPPDLPDTHPLRNGDIAAYRAFTRERDRVIGPLIRGVSNVLRDSTSTPEDKLGVLRWAFKHSATIDPAHRWYVESLIATNTLVGHLSAPDALPAEAYAELARAMARTRNPNADLIAGALTEAGRALPNAERSQIAATALDAHAAVNQRTTDRAVLARQSESLPALQKVVDAEAN